MHRCYGEGSCDRDGADKWRDRGARTDAEAQQTPSRGPLQGDKVLELGSLIAGPFATRLLSEYGADVVKIEPREGGDALRTWRLVHEGTSLWWYS